MTLEEYFDELEATPLQRMDVEHLCRLSSFTPVLPFVADAADRLEETKRQIRDEISRRIAVGNRLEETAFRRQERHEADRHHGERVEQSGRMHVV
jgi:septin family protein